MQILITGKRSFFANKFYKIYKDKFNISFLKKSKNSYYLVNNSIERASNIIHASGTSSVIESNLNPDIDFDKNFLSTIKLINFIKNNNPKNFKKLIYLSTSSVCGDKRSKIKESDSYNPKSVYSHHKMYSEIFLEKFCKSNNIKLVILRIFTIYGEGKRNQFLWDLFQKINTNSKKINLLGSGNEKRDYIHISDLVKIVNSFILKKKLPLNLKINVATGRPITIKKIAELSSTNTKFIFDNSYNAIFPVRMISDNNLLKNYYDYNFIPIEEGISKYKKWYDSL